MISQNFFKHYELGLGVADYHADATNHTMQDTQKTFAWLCIKY